MRLDVEGMQATSVCFPDISCGELVSWPRLGVVGINRFNPIICQMQVMLLRVHPMLPVDPAETMA